MGISFGRPLRAATALLLLLAVASPVLGGHSPAAAAPDLDVVVEGPGAVLIGTSASFTVSVTNNTAAPGYNTGFRIELPVGVDFDTSDAPVPPVEFSDSPTPGRTTLIWENVNDSQPSSTESMTFSLIASTTAYPVGTTFDITTEAYTSDDPRVVPSAGGAGVMTSFTGSGSTSTSTKITAITIDKGEPNPEEELLRGVHNHSTVYTLTVENNPTFPTDTVVVDDYLPAGLEFLGCGTIDNTTDAPTFPGNNVEYSGASRLDASTPDIAIDCPSPSLVETVELDPDGAGPLPLGVYTHVQWGIGNHGIGQVTTINYAAGIPIRENTLSWSGGSAPATDGSQAANLDNNGGTETADEQVLQSHAIVAGDYTGPLGGGATNPVGDQHTHSRTAEDIRILKSVSPENVTQSTATIWTITVDTGEYRTVDNLDVTDVLPDGHCPLGPTNYDTSDPTGECAPTGDNPTVPYTSVTENPDGSWNLVWDDLVNLAASDTFTLSFPSRVRVSYQESGADATPVNGGDGFENTVTLTADDHLIAGIPADEADGTPDVDDSSAGQVAELPSIEKTISESTTPGTDIDCSTATYIDAADFPSAAYAYRPGDMVCYTLRVNIPALLSLKNALVSDFLPEGVTFETNLGATGANQVTDFSGPFDFADGGTLATGDDSLSWELGSTVIQGHRYLLPSPTDRVFEVRFAARFSAAPTGSGAAVEKANLMKLTSQNTAGAAVSLRDQAVFAAVEPELTITKSTPSSQVVAGEPVDYTISIANVSEDPGSGLGAYAQAQNITVTDDLPTPFACTDITSGPTGGDSVSCTGAQITWTINALDPGNSQNLGYSITVPSTIGPSQDLTNTATLGSFEQRTNDAGAITTYTPGLTAEATVTTPGVGIDKLQQSALLEAGNSQNPGPDAAAEEATIGETIEYQLTVDIPEGSTVFDASLTDDLPAGLSPVLATIQATVDSDTGDALPGVPAAGAGFAFDSGNPLLLNFPATYTNPPGSGVDRITLTFDVVIDDVGGNIAGTTLGSGALLNYRPAAGAAPVDEVSPDREVLIVEPNPQIAKDENDADDVILAGQTIDYTLTISNPDGGVTSPAHDLVVVDTIPDRLVPVLPIPDNGVWDAGAGTITWQATTTPSLLTLAPDQVAALTYQATTPDPIPIGGPITNTVNLTATSMPLGVSGERTTYTSSASDTVMTAPIFTTKALNPDANPYAVGETVGFQVTVTLPQSSSAYDITATDALPDGLVFGSTVAITPTATCLIVGASGVTLFEVNSDGATDLAWFLGDTTASGADCVFTIDYTAHVGPTYTGAGTPSDGTPTGDAETFTNGAQTNWMLSQTVGAPTTLADLPTAWDDQSPMVTADVTIAEPQLVLDLDVTSVAGCDASHVADGLADDDDCTIEPGQPALTYTITVRNDGTAPAYDISVTDEPDAEVTNVVAGSGAAELIDGWTVADPVMRWDIPGPLAPGESVTLTYTADVVGSTMLSSTTVIDNTADVASYFGLDPAERSSSPDHRTYGSTFGPVLEDIVTLSLDFPTLVVAKTVASGGEVAEAVVGEPFGWNIAISNAAPLATASGVDLSDTLPVNWDFVAGTAELCSPTCAPLADPAISGGAVSGVALDWTDLIDLASGASAEVRFDALPLPAVVGDPGVGSSIAHTNTAVATADDASGASASADGPYESVADTATARIYQADIRLAKEILTAGPYLQGQSVDYRVTVVNDGPDPATSVVVGDVLSGADLIFITTLGVDGSYDTASGEWTLPDPIVNGGSAQLDLRVTLGEAGTLTNTAEVIAASRFDPDSIPANAASVPEDDNDSVVITVDTASLGSTVWYDVDNSGGDETTKAAEPGIPGVTLNLMAAGIDGSFGTADDFFGPDGVAGGGDDIGVTSAFTDGAGNYAFTDLPDGTYRVVIDEATLPGGGIGWTQTFDNSGALDHTSGDIVLNTSTPSFTAADFSYTGTGSLGDEIFWDIDQSADGVFAATDSPLRAISVDVLWAGFDGSFGTADDVAHPTAETSSLGQYSVGELAPGEYRVTVDTDDLDFPVGLNEQTWDVEHAGPGGADGEPTNAVDVVLNPGDNRSDLDFSFVGTGSISDSVWLDLDNDGVQDPDEPGIPIVTVTATWFGLDGVVGGGDDQVLTTETSSDGTYSFDGLPAGVFGVQIVTSDPDFPRGVVATHDADGTATPDQAELSIGAGEIRDDVDFGYAGTASLGNLVWLDFDGDGTINGPEVGLAEIALDITWLGADGLTGTADDVSLRSETDVDGIYTATSLPLGQYDVAVDIATLPAGLAASFDLDGGFDGSASLTLTATPLDRVDVDFGYRGTGEIGDLVWVDADANGALDGAETGLDGVDIEVVLAGSDGAIGTVDDIVFAVTTAGGGLYGVDGLPAGPLSVSIVGGVPADHAQVSAPDADIDGLWSGVLADGESKLDVDFGFRPDADLNITISHIGEFVVGEDETISLDVVNSGPADADSVLVTTTLPPGVTFLSASGMDCVAVDQLVTCTVDTLANGGSITADIVVVVDEAAAPSFVAAATVESATPDRNLTNNTAADPVLVPLADLSVDIAVPSPLAGGESGTIAVGVTNAGPSSAEAVVVTVDLPSGVTYESVVGDGWVCVAAGSSVVCTLADPLAPGASSSFELAIEVSNTVSGTVAFMASVGSATPQASAAVGSESLNTSVAAADALAATGRNSGSLVSLAVMLIAIGCLLMLVEQRKRARAIRLE